MLRAKWAGAGVRAVVAAVLGGVLVTGGATASFAEAGAGADPVVIDAGNGHRVVVDPETRRFQVTTPTPLVWDSLSYHSHRDPHQWGAGWGYGNVMVFEYSSETTFFFPGLGEFVYDERVQPTHLRGYPRDDVIASRDRGELPPRGDTMPAPRYVWSLYHRGSGVTDYLDGAGRIYTSVDALGGRTEWFYSDEGSQRLSRIVYPDGSMTLIDQISDQRFRITAPDDLMTFVGLRPGSWPLIDEISTFRGDTNFDYNSRSGEGPLSRILSRHPATRARTLIEITWDDFVDGTISRVERNDEVVFPVP